MSESKVVQEAAGSQSTARQRLDSWKEIARYLERDVRTVQRWEKSEGLPVYRLTGSRRKGSPVYAFTEEIDAWLLKTSSSGERRKPDPTLNAGSDWPKRLLLTVLGLGTLIAGVLTVRYFLHLQSPGLPPRPLVLTTLAGLERYPAFSPDGKKVAFSWNGPKQDNADIYVKFLDGGEPLRLTSHPGVDGWPMWSPDGSYIAFGRWVRGSQTAEVLTIPWLGGAERRIHEFPLHYQAANYWPPGCWTPDGKWLILSVAKGALGLVSPETLELRQLTRPEEGSLGDYGPSLSPDGRHLAFLRASLGPVWNLYELSLDEDYGPEDQPKQLTFEPEGVENPMWTGDGKEILYIAGPDGERTLWRIPFDGSQPSTQVPTLSPVGYNWSISPGGDRLVYSDNKWNYDIWEIDLKSGEEAAPILSSTREDINPQFSPDGKKIAFFSSQEKGMRLWVSEADGSRPINLASINGKRLGPARWSPNGKEIVFECREDGMDDICAIPSNGGDIRRLTRTPWRETLPSWSGDGKWIYVTSNRSGSFQIWKIPSDGTETGAMQLTKGGGFAAQESADGRTVFFSRDMMGSNLWSIPAEGGEELQVGDFKIFQCHTYAICREGIYYTITDSSDESFDLRFYRFSDKRSEQLNHLKMRPDRGMSLSPDNRHLLFTAAKGGSADLIIIENFR